MKIEQFKRYSILIFSLIISTIATAQVHKNEIDSLLVKGVLHFNTGDLDSAKTKFSQIIELDPNNDAAYYYMADISILGGDIVSGEMFLKKAAELDSTNFWYSEKLGRIYTATQKVDSGIELYSKLINKYPKKLDSYYSLTNLYIAKKDLAKAAQTIDRIEEITGKDESLVMTRFNIYRAEQQWDKGLEYLIEASKEIESPYILAVIGDLYTSRADSFKAMYYYKKALLLDSQYIPAIIGRAETYKSTGSNDLYFKYIKPFFESKNIKPEAKEEYIKEMFQNASFIRQYKNRVDSLIVKLEEVNPTDSTTLVVAARYYSQVGDPTKCTEILKKNATYNPESLNALLQYILFVYQTEDWRLLEEECKTALVKYPGNTDFIQLLGNALFRQSQFSKAIDVYEEFKTIALDNRDTTSIVVAYSVIGDLYAELENKSKAYSNYNKVLKYDPNNIATLNNYAYYLSVEGKKLKRAYQMSKKTIEAEPDNPTYLDTFGWILFLLDKPIEAKAQFKHAMLYGGKESAVILDHYAEVLFKLKEYDLAFIYWDQAKNLDSTLGINEKIAERKRQMNK